MARFTVVTPATAFRLTTLERARELLDFAPNEDATVNRLIDQASVVIADYCRRPFGIETVRETFLDPRDEVMLERSPVISIDEVKNGNWTFQPGEYQHDTRLNLLWPHTSDGGEYEWAGHSLIVQYTAGYVLPSEDNGAPEPTLPASVERSAIRLVGVYRSLIGRDPRIKSETTEGIGSTSYWHPPAASILADPEAEELLRSYRRIY